MIQLEFSCDDGSIHDMTLARMCLKWGIPATFYIPVDYVGFAKRGRFQPLIPANIGWLARNFEIGSHTITHPLLTRISKETAWDEIHQSKTMLQNLTGKPVNKFAYPRGYANDDLRGMVRTAGYRQARNTLVGNLSNPKDPMWISTAVHIGCNRKEYEGKSWFTYAMEMWSKAKQQARSKPVYFHFWGHGWEIEKNNAWEEVTNFFRVVGR